ncbi:IS5 family transposase [Streptomyces sp. NPDC012403]|uniref:IS5 family transposase n=1 Tax=Streptomyces sp. NPDC012403 TaxID=3364831 RepID=UPI0036E3A5F5
MGERQSRPWIVSDELWSLIEPLLPEPPPKQVKGRPRVPDRQALCGILFVLHTGIQWEYLPQELGFGSGMTCWRRLAAWNEAGVWDQLHQVLLNKLRSKNQLDWSRAVIDSPPLASPGHPHPRPGRTQGPKSGPSPVDRARPGSKHHVITDGQGIPLAVSLTGGNRNDVTQLLPLLDKVPAVAGAVSRPRRRPDTLFADRGYDHDKYRRLLTISWLHGFRRLRIRWERRDDIHEAFLGLAVCLITHRHVQRLC